MLREIAGKLYCYYREALFFWITLLYAIGALGLVIAILSLVTLAALLGISSWLGLIGGVLGYFVAVPLVSCVLAVPSVPFFLFEKAESGRKTTKGKYAITGGTYATDWVSTGYNSHGPYGSTSSYVSNESGGSLDLPG